jgi:hypothetical protein
MRKLALADGTTKQAFGVTILLERVALKVPEPWFEELANKRA